MDTAENTFRAAFDRMRRDLVGLFVTPQKADAVIEVAASTSSGPKTPNVANEAMDLVTVPEAMPFGTIFDSLQQNISLICKDGAHSVSAILSRKCPKCGEVLESDEAYVRHHQQCQKE